MSHAIYIETDDEGWFTGTCACGDMAGGVFPDYEDVADWYGDHRASAARKELLAELAATAAAVRSN